MLLKAAITEWINGISLESRDYIHSCANYLKEEVSSLTPLEM